MPRWLLWTPVAALTAAFGLFGLRAGWHVTDLSESDMINAAANHYVAGADGRKASDCAAMPSERLAVWLTVRCVDSAGQPHVFEANPLGGLRVVGGAAGGPSI